MAKPAPAVRHATRIVQFLADRPRSEFTLSEISRALDLSKTSCLSILVALGEAAFVVKDDQTLRYAIGPAHIGLGVAAAQRFRFIDLARIELDSLCREYDLYWNVGTMAGMEMVVLAASTPRAPAMGFDTGQRFALTPPLGLVYVAWSAIELAERWVEQAVRSDDPSRATEYRAAIEITRQRGFSVGLRSKTQVAVVQSIRDLIADSDRSELANAARTLLDDVAFDEFLLQGIDPEQVYSVSFVSAPLLDAEQRLLGAITIGGFGKNLSGTDVNEFGRRLMACAGRITGVSAPGLL